MKTFLITVISCFSVLSINSQNYSIKDTSVFSHSKYNNISEGIVIDEYFLSKQDYFEYKDSSTTYAQKKAVLDRICPWTYELLYCGEKGLISPYEAYSLMINGEEFHFSYPISKYYFDKKTKHIKIDLKKHCNNCSWELIEDSVIVRMMSKGITKIEQVTSFPMYYSQIAKDIDEVKITVQNKYNEEMHFWLLIN